MQYNSRTYHYPVGKQVTIYKKSITRNEKDTVRDFKEEKKEKNEKFTKSYRNENRTKEQEEHSENVSLSATKNRIYNIARSNAWEWFITLTFDRDKTDSADYDMIVHRIHIFLSNLQKRKCPDLKYLIVPELHADKEHYHFHGLLSGAENLRFCFSGHYDQKGNPVFNIPEWGYGFTTATQVQDSTKASSYITKYITKDTELKLKNKKRYLCSRNVDRTSPVYGLLDEEAFLNANGKDIVYAKNVKARDIDGKYTRPYSRAPYVFISANYYELRDKSEGQNEESEENEKNGENEER